MKLEEGSEKREASGDSGAVSRALERRFAAL